MYHLPPDELEIWIHETHMFAFEERSVVIDDAIAILICLHTKHRDDLPKTVLSVIDHFDRVPTVCLNFANLKRFFDAGTLGRPSFD